MDKIELNSKSNKICCLVVFVFPRFRKSEAFNVISLCLERYRTELLTLKAPITTAADDKFCDNFPNF